ncbi:unnamed protein product [Vicia faba]|uniref:Uncharacterized protein n=1 Tax=Vicia faba TaxID=3906 RepID=A0AAV0ZL20_VICFA|nr:unnamed protein product [Vicia faba]
MTSVIAKRLKNRRGKAIDTSTNKSHLFGPDTRKSKVEISFGQEKSLKRKPAVSSDSEYEGDVRANVEDIASSARKIAAGRKIPLNIPEVPIDNISFHSASYVEKWKFMC